MNIPSTFSSFDLYSLEDFGDDFSGESLLSYFEYEPEFYRSNFMKLDNGQFVLFTAEKRTIVLNNAGISLELTPEMRKRLRDELHRLHELQPGEPKSPDSPGKVPRSSSQDRRKASLDRRITSILEELDTGSIPILTADNAPPPTSFQDAMVQYMTRSRVSEQALSERTGISIASLKRMRTDPKYHPSLEFIIAVCIGMHCGIIESLRLIELGGKSLRLNAYPRELYEDILIFFVFNCQDECVANCNLFLQKKDLPPLTGLELPDHFLTPEEIRQTESMIGSLKYPR